MISQFFHTVLYEPLYNLLIFFAWLVPGNSIGWAIIILTILVRILLWKLSLKTIKAPLMMREHHQEMREIQERYKNDRAAQSSALLAFYREKGVSPFSGCLPLLIQLPVIFVLYQVFMAGLGTVRVDWLYSFTPILEMKNPIFLGLNLSNPDRIFLPILAGVLQYAQTKHMQKINPPISTNPKDPTVMMMKQMVFIFPVMTFVIAFTLPAGLALYWATTAAVSWLQQIYVEKTFVPPTPKVKVTVRTKK